jgi:glycine/D-amino acid oxidase-like deaminating enzyme
MTRSIPAVPASLLQDKRPHAIVIGSGFGGLAAAIRLGARGYRVTVLEKLDAPGGRAYVHRRDGFTFDVGPSLVTLPRVYDVLFRTVGTSLADEVDLVRLDPQFRYWWRSGRHVEVRDDGCGMSPEVHARVFEPFFSTKSTGRGLGLPATDGIVRSHGGALAKSRRSVVSAACRRSPATCGRSAARTEGASVAVEMSRESFERRPRIVTWRSPSRGWKSPRGLHLDETSEKDAHDDASIFHSNTTRSHKQNNPHVSSSFP